jgi:Tol biopolymer transport system component
MTLWTIRPDGTDLQQLTRGEDTFTFAPQWSKDGTRISYWGAGGGGEAGLAGSGIWIMNWDGSEKTLLTPFNGVESTWSPDGTQIVFVGCCADVGVPPNIWMINIDGSGLRQLTTGADGSFPTGYHNVHWSPDGSMIMFDKFAEIEIVDTNGSPIASLGPGAQPRWSPDGSKIIFRTPGPPYTPTGQIWVMNIDGSGRTQLTDIAPNCARPSYRSDGMEIVFHCPHEFAHVVDQIIWRMNADGSSQRQFVEIPGPPSGQPNWFMP